MQERKPQASLLDGLSAGRVLLLFGAMSGPAYASSSPGASAWLWFPIAAILMWIYEDIYPRNGTTRGIAIAALVLALFLSASLEGLLAWVFDIPRSDTGWIAVWGTFAVGVIGAVVYKALCAIRSAKAQRRSKE